MTNLSAHPLLEGRLRLPLLFNPRHLILAPFSPSIAGRAIATFDVVNVQEAIILFQPIHCWKGDCDGDLQTYVVGASIFQPIHCWKGDCDHADGLLPKRLTKLSAHPLLEGRLRPLKQPQTNADGTPTFSPSIAGRAIATIGDKVRFSKFVCFQPIHCWKGDCDTPPPGALTCPSYFQPIHCWKGDCDQLLIILPSLPQLSAHPLLEGRLRLGEVLTVRLSFSLFQPIHCWKGDCDHQE